MPDPREVFDHPFTITLIKVTRGSLNQTTRAYTADSKVESAITGHYSPNPLAEDLRISQDLIEVGDAVLWTTGNVAVGDKVKVVIDSSGNSVTYRVKSLVSRYSIIGKFLGTQVRAGWLLHKEAV